MEPIEDYDLVPESFYTVGWWNKPNPFPEDANEGKKRRKWLKDQDAIERSHQTVSEEGMQGLYAGASLTNNKWPENKTKVIEIPDAR